MSRFIWPLLLVSLCACAPVATGPAAPGGGAGALPVVQARAQTAPVGDPADSDDPAIWVDAADPARSFVIATRKEGGLTVFDLQGQTIQDLNPGGIRYNNVDLVRGFRLGGATVDLAVTSDRRGDRVAAFVIDPQTRTLRDVTSPATPLLFSPSSGSDGKRTAYGLAAYRTGAGEDRVLVSQNGFPVVGEFALYDDGQGVSVRPLRRVELPAQRPGLTVDDPQFEGMVVDAEQGVAFLGQEQIGVWRWDLDGRRSVLLDQVAPLAPRLQADVEGLTLVRGRAGRGYLLVSSQGSNAYAVYSRDGKQYFGSFQVAAGSDLVQDSDGADVVLSPLGSDYPGGLLVVQDGEAGGVEGQTNFKLVSWADVERALKLP
ncbi:MAG: phytase, partial [Deinococcus sp.]|nr:phytase [Deinococcus sp.]